MALLLSLGGLPIACLPEDPPVTTDDGATSTTGGGTTGAPTTGESTGFDPTNKFETDTAAPPPTHEACIAYYGLELRCSGEGTNYAAYWASICDYYIETGGALDGQACADAVAAWYVCLSNLECVLFNGDIPQCVAESAALDTMCPHTFPEPP